MNHCCLTNPLWLALLFTHSRVSLGVQSFDDDVLSNIGRFHRLSDVDASISILTSLNVSYSLDLMSGLPGSTLESWEETVREAGRRRPGHVSVYDLQVEEGTRFGRSYKRNEGMEEDDEGEEEVRMKRERAHVLLPLIHPPSHDSHPPRL